MTLSLLQTLWLAALVAMLVAAAARDVAVQRIPNGVVAAGLAAALGLSLVPGGHGLANAAGGMAAGLLAFLPLYLLRAMGAGDVKLMAAVGAFVGWPGVLGALLYTLVAGGLLSLAGALALRNLRGVLANLKVGLYLSFVRVADKRLPHAEDFPVSRQRMPYALAIAAGTAVQVLRSGALG